MLPVLFWVFLSHFTLWLAHSLQKSEFHKRRRHLWRSTFAPLPGTNLPMPISLWQRARCLSSLPKDYWKWKFRARAGTSPSEVTSQDKTQRTGPCYLPPCSQLAKSYTEKLHCSHDVNANAHWFITLFYDSEERNQASCKSILQYFAAHFGESPAAMHFSSFWTPQAGGCPAQLLIIAHSLSTTGWTSEGRRAFLASCPSPS